MRCKGLQLLSTHVEVQNVSKSLKSDEASVIFAYSSCCCVVAALEVAMEIWDKEIPRHGTKLFVIQFDLDMNHSMDLYKRNCVAWNDGSRISVLLRY